MSPAWPWSGRSLPQEEPVEVLGPWTWAQCGQDPSPLTTNYVTNPKSESWTFCTWLVDWPIAADWLTGYLTKCQPDTPPSRDIWWPSVLLLWSGHHVVRCTSRQRHPVAKCDTSSPMGQVYLKSDVPPQPETSCGQV